jgi:hypothetical protein
MRNGLGQTTLAGDVIRATDSAVLFERNDGAEFWVPRRCCLQGDEVEVGDTDLVVADWWLEKQGLGK